MARVQMLRGIMLASSALLLLFLGYWLRSRYHSERDHLQNDLSATLSVVQQDISDSVIMRQVFGNKSVHIGEVKARPSRPPGTSGGGPVVTFLIRKNDTMLSPALNKAGLKVHGQKREVTFTSRTDTISPTVVRSLGSVLEKTGVFSDSFHVMFIGDTTLIKKTFNKRLNDSGRHFQVLSGTEAAKQSVQGISVELKPHLQFVVAGYQSFLLKKITPDILFALLLLGLTSGAFWLSLRSLRQQMHLSMIRNELVSNMSHELKTPVATVKVALEALSDREVRKDGRTLEDYVSIASLELARLEMLINQTLHTSLLEEGKMMVQLHPIDLRELVNELSRTMMIRFTQQAATLNITFSGDDFVVRADRLHVQGVLLNVLDNALKYGGAGVSVEVALRAQPDGVLVSICDDGPGIPAAYHRSVFEKFFRVPTQNLHQVKGYGLGLSYAAQVVQQHKGSIHTEDREGHGCCFIIQLPKAQS